MKHLNIYSIAEKCMLALKEGELLDKKKNSGNLEEKILQLSIKTLR